MNDDRDNYGFHDSDTGDQNCGWEKCLECRQYTSFEELQRNDGGWCDKCSCVDAK